MMLRKRLGATYLRTIMALVLSAASLAGCAVGPGAGTGPSEECLAAAVIRPTGTVTSAMDPGPPFWATAATATTRLAIEASTIVERYCAGTEHDLWVSLVLEDPRETVAEGVLFLNVVENNPERDYPQAAHRLFSNASGTPQIFGKVFSGAALRGGRETTVSVVFRGDAPPGDYAIVFQAFAGRETDPNRVDVAKRVGLAAVPFTVVR